MAEWMMKIVLAIEDSKYSDAVTQTLLAQAKPGETQVCVLHVVEPPSLLLVREMGGFEASLEAAWQARQTQAEVLVAKTAQVLRSHALDVTTSIEQGDPKTQIIDKASSWGADLIIVGSHGQTGLERFLIGSVSDAVARHAPCSVEIVRIRRAT
jgi:nucleotide-binding universal stress UspA family protein